MLPAEITRHRFTVEEYHKMTEAGVFSEDEHGEPQPDLALLRELPAGRLPCPEEVLLVVEVADTTLSYDTNVKLPLYDRAGISEAWIVDLQGDVVEVHADPRANGYARTSRYDRKDSQLRSEILPDLTLPVGEILG
jgi:Uma2 family endonuclease